MKGTPVPSSRFTPGADRSQGCTPARTIGRYGPFIAFVLLFLLATAGPATGAPVGQTDGWTQVVKNGFGDPNNSYASFYARFKDYLYLSTIANPAGFVFSKSHKEGGDIWRTRDGVTWEQIGKPGLGNPHNSTFNFATFKDRLYAVSVNLNDHGIEIWVSSDGASFTQIEKGGFGDKNSDSAVPFVFNDRLILGVANVKNGAEIWVSEDGVSFRQVVSGGMGDAGNTGLIVQTHPQEPGLVLQNKLYVGVSNPTRGGEVWRTADGLKWERVADKGLGRPTNVSLAPGAVFQNRLYVTGEAVGGLDKLEGLQVFRTPDGTTWERVVSDGFGAGPERNITGSFTEFNGQLYLTSNTMDPRLLLPSRPSERRAPRGFQLRRSSDGKQWTKVGEDGFGADTSLYAAMDEIGGTAYLAAYDYHQGDQLWQSANGSEWKLIFREPVPSMFSMGGGPLDLKRHLLWIDNDLARGAEIWRSDQALVADVTTTSLPRDTGGAGSTQPGGATGAGGAQGNTSGGGAEAHVSGLSGGWLALLIAVAIVAVLALVASAFAAGMLVRRRAGATSIATGGPPASSAGNDGESTAGAGLPDGDGSPAFCSACGAALETDAVYCAACGRRAR